MLVVYHCISILLRGIIQAFVQQRRMLRSPQFHQINCCFELIWEIGKKERESEYYLSVLLAVCPSSVINLQEREGK